MRNKITYAMIILSVLFIGIGIWRDEVSTVLVKSVNICLECIGIG